MAHFLDRVATQAGAERERNQSSKPHMASPKQRSHGEQDEQKARQAKPNSNGDHSAIAERLGCRGTKDLDKNHAYTKVRPVSSQ